MTASENRPAPRETPFDSQLFAVTTRLADVLHTFFANTRIRVTGEDLSPAQAVAFYAIAKATKTYRAVLILRREGCPEDAMILLRSLFELALEFRYIAQDPESDRACRWLDYEWVTKYEFHKTISTDPLFAGYRERAPSSTENATANRVEDDADGAANC